MQPLKPFGLNTKKRGAKKLARHLWHSLAKAGDLPDLGELCAALQYFCKSESWQGEYGRHVPQLAN